MPTFHFSGGPLDGQTMDMESADYLLELNGWFYLEAGTVELGSGTARRMLWTQVPGGLTGPTLVK